MVHPSLTKRNHLRFFQNNLRLSSAVLTLLDCCYCAPFGSSRTGLRPGWPRLLPKEISRKLSRAARLVAAVVAASWEPRRATAPSDSKSGCTAGAEKGTWRSLRPNLWPRPVIQHLQLAQRRYNTTGAYSSRCSCQYLARVPKSAQLVLQLSIMIQASRCSFRKVLRDLRRAVPPMTYKAAIVQDPVAPVHHRGPRHLVFPISLFPVLLASSSWAHWCIATLWIIQAQTDFCMSKWEERSSTT
ncbi:XK-related protein 7 [Lates japonicus]|uniref:XK-related protein 7 n=1 Tax=Lates japonicus TaxID=270547 RepID=A0AAD3MAJ8_LATJO|nr:XK-related protein 7 [Lates japonicus]